MDAVAIFFIFLGVFLAGISVGVALTWNSATKVAGNLIEAAAQKAEAETAS